MSEKITIAINNRFTRSRAYFHALCISTYAAYVVWCAAMGIYAPLSGHWATGVLELGLGAISCWLMVSSVASLHEEVRSAIDLAAAECLGQALKSPNVNVRRVDIE